MADDVVNLEAEAAALSDSDKLAEVDLDDQTPAMGDSVHTYLKSIGRTSLLTGRAGGGPGQADRGQACSPSTSWRPRAGLDEKLPA